MNIGILACGGIAQVMATTLKGMGDAVSMYACASRDIEKSKAFAEKNGFKKYYGSYEELVKDDDVSLVYIASPHSHHYEHIKLCLENGKNVICEKPLTVNSAQAREVFKLAEDKGLLLTEAIWPRYQPLFKTLKEVLDSGAIGEISMVSANMFYDIDKVKRIYDPSLAGGALLDVGVYSLTFASLCLGEDIDEMITACHKFDTGVDAQTTVILKYPDGKMANTFSGTAAVSDRMGTISGRDGYIVVENIYSPGYFLLYDKERKLVREYKAPSKITGYEFEVYAAMDAIRKGETQCPDCPHSKTIRILELMDMAREQMGIKYPFE